MTMLMRPFGVYPLAGRFCSGYYPKDKSIDGLRRM